jgi:hypothetical protein
MVITNKSDARAGHSRCRPEPHFYAEYPLAFNDFRQLVVRSPTKLRTTLLEFLAMTRYVAVIVALAGLVGRAKPTGANGKLHVK